MIMDVLGILIAFVALILLLSLIVTSLVQATQAVLRLRARNLQRGLMILLANIREDTDKDLSVQNAAKVLIMADPTKPDHKKLKDDTISIWTRIFGPKVSVVDCSELLRALKDSGIGLSRAQFYKIKGRFSQFERFSSKRFKSIIRGITIGWALLIVAFYQVSTPHLLKELSASPELRTKYIELAEQRKIQSPKVLNALSGFNQVPEKALDKLELLHPELKDHIEEVRGIDSEKADIESKLKEVLLKRQGNNEAVLEEYNIILDGLYKKEKDENFIVANSSSAQLGLYEITGWSQGWEFFCSEGQVNTDNVIGVLISAILVSFGAPFWFEQLQRLIGLRDALKRNNA